ncbi:MAG: two-component sensor histidine kinase, partial [Mycobacterium sp.]
MWPLRRDGSVRSVRLPNLGVPARSAAVSAIVVLVALSLAGAVLDAILYRSLLDAVDDATAARVRNIVEELQSEPPGGLDSALLATDQHVVAVQLIAPDGKVISRSGLAPDSALIPVTRFDLNLRRGIPDDEVPTDNMRISGQRVNTATGEYTVLVGGGSEAVEATARTVALLFACGAPIIIAVAAAATYWLVRRSLQSV